MARVEQTLINSTGVQQAEVPVAWERGRRPTRIATNAPQAGAETVACGTDDLRRTRTLIKPGGTRGSFEYNSWRAMKARCYNPKHRNYQNYGGRGIRVCRRWLESFAAFLQDLGPRPEGTTLDRIDTNRDYEPGNVRWATARVQQRNRRNNHVITAFGETLLLQEWAERLGTDPAVLVYRLKAGWGPERAVSEPVSRKRRRAKATSSLSFSKANEGDPHR